MIAIFLIITAFCANGYFNFSFAEEKIEPYYPVIQKKQNKKECLKNFNIDTINFLDDNRILEKKIDNGKLARYFECRAAAENNINECNRLSSPDLINTCKSYFSEDYGTFGRLVITGYLTPEILYDLSKLMEMSVQKTKEFAHAWLKDDTSFCDVFSNDPKKYSRCKAGISGNSKFCQSSEPLCINRAIYINAIKTSDIKKCEEIKGDEYQRIKLICKLVIAGDAKICEESNGFIEFRNDYCE